MLLAIGLSFCIPLNSLAGSCPPGYSEWNTPLCNDGNPFNGYWWRNYWVPGYPSVESWFTPAPTWFYGKALRYAPGVMEATAKWRGLSLEGYIDGVALMSPADIGKEVWLRRPTDLSRWRHYRDPDYPLEFREWEGPYLVVDCAARGDIWATILHLGNTLEVGHKTAMEWGMDWDWDGPHLVRYVQVSKIDPRFLEGEPVYYPDWWLGRVEKAWRYGPRVVFKPPDKWLIGGEWKIFNSNDSQGTSLNTLLRVTGHRRRRHSRR